MVEGSELSNIGLVHIQHLTESGDLYGHGFITGPKGIFPEHKTDSATVAAAVNEAVAIKKSTGRPVVISEFGTKITK